MNKIDDREAAKLLSLLKSGRTYRQVQRITGVHVDTLRRLRTGAANYNKPNPDARPGDGFCECGCGGVTNTSPRANANLGLKAGEHYRWIFGHWHLAERKLNPEHGAQYQRAKRREAIRRVLVEVVLESDGMTALEEIRRKIAPEFKLEGCSRMLNMAREWGGIVASDGKWQCVPNIPRVVIRRAAQKRPEYERPEISYERETELSMMVNRRDAILLDGVVFEGDSNRHMLIDSGSLTPLEMLLLKEDLESEEQQSRQRRIAEWEQWVERRNSAFATQ